MSNQTHEKVQRLIELHENRFVNKEKVNENDLVKILYNEVNNLRIKEKVAEISEMTNEQVERIALKVQTMLVQEKEGLVLANRSTQKVDEQEKVLAEFLPILMSEEEIEQTVTETIDKLAATKKDMGKVMGMLSKQLKGKADLKVVNKIVKLKLV